MNVILLSIDLLNKVFTIINPDLPRSLYERWKLLGDLFIALNIGEFRQNTLYLNDSLSEHELQFIITAFTKLVGTLITVRYDVGNYYWKFQLVEENRNYLENENTPF